MAVVSANRETPTCGSCGGKVFRSVDVADRLSAPDASLVVLDASLMSSLAILMPSIFAAMALAALALLACPSKTEKVGRSITFFAESPGPPSLLKSISLKVVVSKLISILGFLSLSLIRTSTGKSATLICSFTFSLTG